MCVRGALAAMEVFQEVPGAPMPGCPPGGAFELFWVPAESDKFVGAAHLIF